MNSLPHLLLLQTSLYFSKTLASIQTLRPIRKNALRFFCAGCLAGANCCSHFGVFIVLVLYVKVAGACGAGQNPTNGVTGVSDVTVTVTAGKLVGAS